jgi:hypothetical protein
LINSGVHNSFQIIQLIIRENEKANEEKGGKIICLLGERKRETDTREEEREKEGRE